MTNPYDVSLTIPDLFGKTPTDAAKVFQSSMADWMSLNLTFEVNDGETTHLVSLSGIVPEDDNPDQDLVDGIQSVRNRLAVTGDYADTIRAAHAMLGNLIGEQNPVQPFEHWGNDPDHPVEDWKSEVAHDYTRLSYAEWLAVKRED